jgi:single-strand DNA-binding protein
MNSMNRVFLMGHLGSTPQINTSKNGKLYVRLSVATNRVWQNEAGAKEEKTEWHRIMVWGGQGENCVKYLKKGSPVMVEGYLSHFEHKNEDGKTRYDTVVTAKDVSFLPHPD